MNDILSSWHDSKHNFKDVDGEWSSVYGLPQQLSGAGYAEFRNWAIAKRYFKELTRPYTEDEDGMSLKGAYVWTDQAILDALLTTVDSRHTQNFVENSIASMVATQQETLKAATEARDSKLKTIADLDVTGWVSENFIIAYTYRDGAYTEKRRVSAKDLTKYDRRIHTEIVSQVKVQVKDWVKAFLELLHRGSTIDMHKHMGIPMVDIKLKPDQLQKLGTNEVVITGFINLSTLIRHIDLRTEQVEKFRPQDPMWDLFGQIKDIWRKKLWYEPSADFTLAR